MMLCNCNKTVKIELYYSNITYKKVTSNKFKQLLCIKHTTVL